MGINMEDKKTGKKALIVIVGIIAFLVCINVCGMVIMHIYKEKAFDANEELYFKMFANTYDEGEYEFYSLDAYYLIDTGLVFYNGKFKAYIELEDKWVDVDQVVYGTRGNVENMYCRSWEDLYEFEEIDKEFQRTIEDGMHKEYTKEEIEELLKEAYEAKK